jgi:hypothetical protein
VGSPIHVYPLYENGFRAHRKQTIQANHRESAALYAYFSQIASQNPYAWNNGMEAQTTDSIGTLSKKNRMICFPCGPVHIVSCMPMRLTTLVTDPLLMNAFNTVNLASACILTSTEYATQLGIPKDRWIYPLGGAGFNERENCESAQFYLIGKIPDAVSL